ncbi:aspartic peptidase domain-containing protein [Phaeosphaeria sp. MPI-PUGE-AT-0046c]|nr:aspartic peptidase domain-containing protein [Phaeosphaeria sp. MPI-PUGE-AT-0046c]
MSSLLVYLSAAVLFVQSTVAFNCSKKPIYVDIHKRAVHDSPVFQYGSFIGLGTPAQNQSLWPSLAQNHTSFASHSYCSDNSTLRDCDRSTGGFFNNEDSTTSTQDRAGNASFSGFFGQESVRLYTHYFETEGASQNLIENSTVQVATQGSIRPSRVGMGSSSTLLRDLAARDMIAGKTYSLYIGQGFDRAGGMVNGSNVFGGYDSGRFTGTPNKYPMNIANVNPMSLRIKDIVITDTKDNSNVSLFDNKVFTEMKAPAATFEAQITTEQFPLSLPYQITKNFIARLSAEKDNYWGDNSLKLKNDFSGTLTIVLEDGFTVTFPPEVLMNASRITPIQDRTEDDKTPFRLGSAFLGQVYLMADYETNNFFLADAVQKNNMVMPMAWCPKTDPVAYERPNQSAWQRQGLIGAVIGGVIGGIGTLAALYCLWVAILRKKDERKLKRELEKNQQSKMAQFDVEEAPSFDPPPSKASKVLFWKKS